MFNKEFDMKTAFLDKNYTYIFNVRFRTGRKEWDLPRLNARQEFFMEENTYRDKKNILYIHIPFCVSRCNYCPYYSTMYSQSLIKEYLEALQKEMQLIRDTPYIKSTRFECIFLGGGTPSILKSDELRRLSEMIRESFQLTDDVEVTLESNPATLTEEKIDVLKEYGYTRVSLGIQSFNDEILKKINCAHTSSQAKRVIDLLLDRGIVVNIDMLFGLAGQTCNDWKKELECLCNIERPHQLTLFPLRIIPNTPLHTDLLKEGKLDLEQHNKNLLELDALTESYLIDNLYSREEVPLFYYRKGSYPHRYHSAEGRIVGIGSSSGSILEGVESGNHYDVRRYIDDLKNGEFPIVDEAYFTKEQIYERFILFRILFMNRSLPDFKDIVKRRFEEYFSIPMDGRLEKVTNDMCEKGFIKISNGRIVFTERMWKILAHLKIGTPSIL